VGVLKKCFPKKTQAEIRRALLLALFLAALWAVLAIVRSGVTYHLAPLLVAAVPALGARAETAAGRVVPQRLAAVGLAGALGVTLLLSALGRLDGPSLLPFGGAATEAVLFSALGAAAAWGFGSRLAGIGSTAG